MAKRATEFLLVGRVVAAFVERGCELRVAEPMVRLADGDCLNARYLVSLATGQFVALVDVADADSVADAEVQFWERRLGIRLPRPI